MNHAESPTERKVFDDERIRFEAGKFAMWLLLASLGVLFIATIIGFAVMRIQSPAWSEHELPTMPAGLWLSTALLVASSVTLHRAICRLREGDEDGLRWGLMATTALGVGFLMFQALAWQEWRINLEGSLLLIDDPESRFAAVSFYILTGVHAAHVIGGIIPLFWITIGAMASRYTPTSHAPVYFTAMYWHFLDAVWLALFATLLLGG